MWTNTHTDIWDFYLILKTVRIYKEISEWERRENRSEYCKLSEHDLIIYARYFNAIFVLFCDRTKVQAYCEWDLGIFK